MIYQPSAFRHGRLGAAAGARSRFWCSHSGKGDAVHWRGSSSAVTPYDFVKTITASSRTSSPWCGQAVHSMVVKLGLLSNTFISSALVDMYCKWKKITNAQMVFDAMTQRNVVSWNSLIRGYTQVGLPAFSLRLFVEMIATGVPPSPFSVSSVILACSLLEAREMGIMVHCVCVKWGFCSNVIVGTSMVGMYSKCCYDMNSSRRIFDEMPDRNVVTWTSLVAGYAVHKRTDDAMLTVNEMRISGMELNEVTYSSLLSCLSGNGGLLYGKQIHCLVVRHGMEFDLYVLVAMMSMYSKCDSAQDFMNMFHTISTEDQVLHNSIVAGFSHLGNLKGVLMWFNTMRQRCIDMDDYTFGSLLKIIGISSALKEGKQTHALVLKCGYASNMYVQNGLVAMYARCGAISDSKTVFSYIRKPDIVSWNSLIAGCALHGHGWDAIELFEQLRSHGIKPNSMSYLSVLSACSHVGLLEKGIEYFNLMIQRDDLEPTPRMEHYSSMVDLLGRAGYLSEAESIIKNIPVKPGPSIYKSLINACHLQGDTKTATRVAQDLLELSPNDPASYVLLSNVLANESLWEASSIVRERMMERGLRKNAGWSWIEKTVDENVTHGGQN